MVRHPCSGLLYASSRPDEQTSSERHGDLEGAVSLELNSIAVWRYLSFNVQCTGPGLEHYSSRI
jgi:hypothetical protein